MTNPLYRAGLAAALLGDTATQPSRSSGLAQIRFARNSFKPDSLEQAAWDNVPVSAYFPDGQTKFDAYNNIIVRSEYGKRTKWGWQIDHYPVPQSLGGQDIPSNVRALHHEANAKHGGHLGDVLSRL
jgi:hypothetical protein